LARYFTIAITRRRPRLHPNHKTKAMPRFLSILGLEPRTDRRWLVAFDRMRGVAAPYTYLGMAFGFPTPARKQFVVACKQCSRDVPAGVEAFPFASVVVTCTLCGEQRRYRPSEVYLGVPNQLVERPDANMRDGLSATPQD
jgi:hypothetical protein